MTSSAVELGCLTSPGLGGYRNNWSVVYGASSGLFFLTKKFYSIFETDLVAATQPNSESGGKVGVVIIIYSFLFY